MAADSVLNFFFLNGDATRDRVVDVTNLGILAANWKQSLPIPAAALFSKSGLRNRASLVTDVLEIA